MDNKGGSRAVDDEDIADGDVNDAITIASSDEDKPPPRLQKNTLVKKEPGSVHPVARRPPSDRLQPASRTHRASRSSGQDILTNISSALDPAAHAARGEDRAARSLQSTQIFTLTTQLRDTQTIVEALRNRLAESDRERNAAERRADRAEMMGMLSGSRGHRDHGHRDHSRRDRSHRDRSHRDRSPHRHNRTQRQDVYYADGGRATRWVGSGDSDAFPTNDSPGTRRYNDLYASPVHPSASMQRIPSTPRPVSPFRFPDIFEPSSRHHAPPSRIRTRRHAPSSDFEVTVTPSRAERNAGVSFTISPHPNNAAQQENVHILGGNAGGEQHL